MLKIFWFHLRNHFTKAIGALAFIVGYSMQNQATWVTWLNESERGTAVKWFGVATFFLGIYNYFWPPQPPQGPTS